MAGDYMLSTADNPFNPYTQWDDWYLWDYNNGYHTPAYLARMVITSYNLSEADQHLAITDAMDRILELNLTGNYIKVDAPSTPT